MKQSLDLVEIIKCAYEVFKDMLPSISIVVVALISNQMVITSANKSTNQQKAEELQKNLEDFYYPFLLLSKKTTQLYEALGRVSDKVGKFSDEIGKVSNEGCNSCLLFLLTGNKFKGNALIIWKEIILNNKKLNELIIQHSSIISNKSLRNDLSKLSTHYTLLELADKDQLIGNENELCDYVFPSEVINNIEAEIDKILKKIQNLIK